MKSKINAEFTFHNVGEGLFYSGHVQFNNKILNFVYDCGSNRREKVEKAISRYRERYPRDKIDLLIISHLHKDHVSGVNTLLQNFKIDVVVLPYFNRWERLYIALANPGMPLWYYDFLDDPIEFLFEYKINKIVLIGRGEGRREEIPRDRYYPDQGETEDNTIDLRRMEEDPKLRDRVIREEPRWKGWIDEGRLIIKSHYGYLIGSGIWLFRFFNHEIDDIILINFIVCVGRINFDNNSIKYVFESPESYNKLKNCYKMLSKRAKMDYNDTSLVLYHEPLIWNFNRIQINYSISLCSEYPFLQVIDRNYYSRLKALGQFLTGDINLKNSRTYVNLKNHYIAYLNRVAIGLTPHHGSSRNWNSQILNDTPYSILWISSGSNRVYGHPSSIVIQDIINSNRRFYCVNEYFSATILYI